MKRKWFEKMLIEFISIITWGDATRENGWFRRPGIVPVENYQPGRGKPLPLLIHSIHLYK